MTEPTDLTSRLRQLNSSMAQAAIASGRDPQSVRLLAVSKQQTPAAIRTLVGAGQREFGESYLQEALPKMEALRDLDLIWHFVGQLQSNKTRAVAEHFQWLHTLDRDRIATRLNDQRPHYATPLNVCIQVKLAEEAGKGGVWPDEALPLAEHIRQLPRLRLRGLMCIPTPRDDYAGQLAQFQRMQALLNELNAKDFALDTLSMGMSDDYAAAIAAGATIVRIGTALFGERTAQQ